MIKPSQEAVRRIRRRLAAEVRSMRGSNAMAVIARLNPIIRGWAAYYRGVVSSKIFTALDHYVWWLTYRWARHSHPKKSKKWVVRRYFGRFNKSRNDRWVFGARDEAINDRGDIPYLVKFSWTHIVRHQLVAGGASPDDPYLAEYWAARRRKVPAPIDDFIARLLARQNERCPLCREHLMRPYQRPDSPQAWERWWLSIVKRAVAVEHLAHHEREGMSGVNRICLMHASCYRSLQARRRRNPESSSLAASSGLA